MSIVPVKYCLIKLCLTYLNRAVWRIEMIWLIKFWSCSLSGSALSAQNCCLMTARLCWLMISWVVGCSLAPLVPHDFCVMNEENRTSQVKGNNKRCPLITAKVRSSEIPQTEKPFHWKPEKTKKAKVNSNVRTNTVTGWKEQLRKHDESNELKHRDVSTNVKHQEQVSLLPSTSCHGRSIMIRND